MNGQIAKSNDVKLISRGGYWYMEGAGSMDDRNAIVASVREKLQAISPEAFALAQAFHAAAKWQPAGRSEMTAKMNRDANDLINSGVA